MDFRTWWEMAALLRAGLRGVSFNWVQMAVDKYEDFCDKVGKKKQKLKSVGGGQ